MRKKITSALISVYYKENLEPVIQELKKQNVKIYSTGGTKKFIEELGVHAIAVEDLTGYPSILGGRVKTLHPKIFGGILSRRDVEKDKQQLEEFEIPEFDLIIVDLYPFEETVKLNVSEQEIIEKIDIGGITLIRAAAKNFKDVLVVSSCNQYSYLLEILRNQDGFTTLEQRKAFAKQAFNISSHYDTLIYKYFAKEDKASFKASYTHSKQLRYGENPHQEGIFYGKLNEIFEQLSGKEISYNNLLDIDAAIHLIDEFNETTFVVMKHNNACGLASRDNLIDAWKDALAGDPISAFGGILACNRKLDMQTANEISKLFYEVLIAPDYEEDALEVLTKNKKRIILKRKDSKFPQALHRTILNGVLYQSLDNKTDTKDDLKVVTLQNPSFEIIEDLLFANIVVKHSKSNAIVIVKNKQLLASGVGQTSRVDALKQAIQKANSFEFDLQNAVMASDAFFPFADSVEIAHKAGINAVIQPGGSIRDKDSIAYCNANNISMVFTGTRHFKH